MKKYFAITLALAFGFTTNVSRAQDSSSSVFGDISEDLDFYAELDLALLNLYAAYISTPSNDITTAFFTAATAYYNLDAGVFDTYEDFLAGLADLQTSLYDAALAVYDGVVFETGRPLIDKNAFAMALANVANEPGWSANAGLSNQDAWYALWLLLYAAEDVQEIIDGASVV
jgi:hypothetical protein